MSILDNEGHDPLGFGNTPPMNEVAALRAEIERLRGALRPFAANFQIGSGYNRDDFDRASRAYGEIVIGEPNV